MTKTDKTDNQLIDSIKEGDYISYNTLFMRYYPNLCQYVWSIIVNKNDAEDIIQDLFLLLWDNHEKLDIQENVSGYLYKMAKNLTLNQIRKTANYRNILENQVFQQPYYEENLLEADEFRIALFDCINQLPERCKKILLLHRIKELKQKEIAEKLDISVKTIKNQIWISLQKLRVCLELKGI